MIPFANKGKQLILLPEDYVKTHYIGKLYGKHFEQSKLQLLKGKLEEYLSQQV